MNADDTQLLDDTENTCVTGILVMKEVNWEVTKNEELSHDSINQSNAESIDKKTAAGVKLSNYCLKLVNPNQLNQAENFLLPLSIGLNKIGRSNANDICILDLNLSKNHANIDVKVVEEGGSELHECVIHDLGSLNKIKINNKQVLQKNEKHKLQIDDKLLFGLTNFKFIKVK